MSSDTGLVQILRDRAQREPDRVSLNFLANGEVASERLTYGELHARACAIAAAVVELGGQGRSVLLTYPEGVEYVAAFFGCLYAGSVPVPAYPPNPARLARVLPRLVSIVHDADAPLALTTSSVLARAEEMWSVAPALKNLRWLATDSLAPGSDASIPAGSPSPTAFLQYTSGSTSQPKGVVIGHDNLLATLRYLTDVWVDRCPESVGVSWLPPFHDLGLIVGILGPIYSGFPVYMMSPVAFLQRPQRWLQAISRYRGTISAAPNFAYELCAASVSPEIAATLDLRSWAMAGNAAEPIRWATIERFSAKFAPAGFRPAAFSGGYGLAEATVAVSGERWEVPPRMIEVDAAALERGEVVLASPGVEKRQLVGCGKTATSAISEIAIVDPDTLARRAADKVGEIWLRGPGIAGGYWKRPEETVTTFGAHVAESGDGPFLRTGDLGFVHEGDVFITGRIKELIILRGRNIYPHDLELTVQNLSPALRAGCGAAFSTEGDEERLVVVQEVDTQQPIDLAALMETVEHALAEGHDVMAEVVFVRRGQVPKTSSGKIQRRLCRTMYAEGRLEAPPVHNEGSPSDG